MSTLSHSYSARGGNVLRSEAQRTSNSNTIQAYPGLASISYASESLVEAGVFCKPFVSKGLQHINEDS